MPGFRDFTYDDLDWLVAEHAHHYTAIEGFDGSFVPLVRDVLEAFLSAHNPEREAGWIMMAGTDRLGSIFLTEGEGGFARVRLVYLVSAARGLGFGHALLFHARDFAKRAGYAGLQVATYDRHVAACGLYASGGWRETAAFPAIAFGQDMTELHFEMRF